MRITIVSNSKNWCVNQIAQVAERDKIELDILDFKNACEGELFSDWGNVVILRNTVLDKLFERPLISNSLNKANVYVLNRVLLDNPLIIHKSFQQKIIKDYVQLSQDTELKPIATYNAKNKEGIFEIINKGYLKFPIIEKLDLDAQGKSVVKIDKIEDIKDTKDKIYQNFIPNEGDFRILCLGGKVLGVIKRVAKVGDFRNNFSQGGSVDSVQDKDVVDKVSKIALKVASIFNLDFCGVDIICNKNSGEYSFLEVNTYPWWEGFQRVTGMNVADKIIEHCVDAYDRSKKGNKGNYDLINKCYQDGFECLEENKFHYFSRRYLWFDGKIGKEELKKIKSNYIGSNKEDTEEIIKNLLASDVLSPGINEIELRLPLLRKYEMLANYNKVLFKVLFSDIVYEEDIRTITDKYLQRDKMLELKEVLEDSSSDMAILSTYAINFIYNLENYLFKDKENDYFIDPEKYYEIAKNAYSGEIKDKHNLRIYFITHCIINESRFYSRTISRHKSIYLKMIKLAEDIICENYFDINLDNKLEFLVCAKILDYRSNLFEIIYSETQNSLAHSGNYLIDVCNKCSVIKNKNDFRESEHRNILYLMAFSKASRFEKGK
ncbi:MAG: hypothetical protein WC178_01360 [Candidatus Paceibacterota bacterium]